MKRKRERLETTPRRKSGFFYRARPKKKSRKRLRLPPELAAPRFIELMQEIGSNNHSRRHRAARRLAAHCAVVFRE